MDREKIIDGYIVSIDGQILSPTEEGLLPIGNEENGRVRISSSNRVAKHFGTSLVHRIIIAAFHPKFVNRTYDIKDRHVVVKHINGDTLDNHYDNLEVLYDKQDTRSKKKQWYNTYTGVLANNLKEVFEVENMSKTQFYKSTERYNWIKKERR